MPHWPAPVSVVSLVMPSLCVVVRLRHGGVRLVRPGRADALVLVVDPRRRVERLLQPVRPEQRRGPPQPVHVEHPAGDVDVPLAGDLLERSAPSGTAGRGRPGRPAAACPGAAAAAAGSAGRATRLYHCVGSWTRRAGSCAAARPRHPPRGSLPPVRRSVALRVERDHRAEACSNGALRLRCATAGRGECRQS